MSSISLKFKPQFDTEAVIVFANLDGARITIGTLGVDGGNLQQEREVARRPFGHALAASLTVALLLSSEDTEVQSVGLGIDRQRLPALQGSPVEVYDYSLCRNNGIVE